MQQEIHLQLSPKDASNPAAITLAIAQHLGKKTTAVSGFHCLKKSIDARKSNVLINMKVNAFIDEPFFNTPKPDSTHKKKYSSLEPVQQAFLRHSNL